MTIKTALYGHVFEMAPRYTEGHPLTANEADALNARLLEMISHKLRTVARTKIATLDKSTSLADYPEVVAEMSAALEKEAAEYVFGEGRGAGEPRVVLDPLSKRALDIADAKVRAAIAKDAQWKKIGKKDGSNADEPGIYPWAKFEATRAKYAEHPAIVAAAKKALAAEEKAAGEDPIVLEA